MRLSKKDLKAAARHARELAMECVTGTAPPFGTGIGSGMRPPFCAVGTIDNRLGHFLNGYPGDEMDVVLEANDQANDHADRHARVVFPLLALADALDEAAVTSGASAPKGPTEAVLEEL